VLVGDAAAGSIAARLSAWYRAGVNASPCWLLPLAMRGAPFARICADNKTAADSIEHGECGLSPLGALRTQVVMAFPQAG
jgi:eukaryotic-like serine/threonine-protein kinase